jgi:hypothetical protein
MRVNSAEKVISRRISYLTKVGQASEAERGEVISNRIARCLLLVIAFVALLFRYPPDFNARGQDTFYIASFAESVTVHGYFGWVIHPLSFFGLMPASLPAGGPSLFASLSMIGGIPVGAGIVINDLVLAVLSVGASFLLGRALFIRNWPALALSAAFAMSPRFLVFTEASGSTRSFILAFFPIVLLMVLRAGTGRVHRTSFLAISLVLLALMAVFHRSFLLALAVLPAYLVSRVRWPRWDVRAVRFLRSTGYAVCVSGIVVAALVGGLTQIVPRENDYTSGALLHGTSLLSQLANLLLDYGSSLGAVIVFAPLGLWQVLRRFRWQFEDRLLLSGLLLYAPLLVLGQYTILLVLPLFAIFSVLGFLRTSRRWLHRPAFAAIGLSAILVSTSISGVYMVDRWQAPLTRLLFLQPDVYGASVYLSKLDPHAFFVSDDWSSASYKIWSISGNPALSWDLAIPLSEGVITAEDLDVQFHLSPLSFYQVTSGLLERTHWIALMTNDPTSSAAQYIIHLYHLRYFVRSLDYPLDPSTSVFITAIKQTQYEVWSSPTYEIWTVPQS